MGATLFCAQGCLGKCICFLCHKKCLIAYRRLVWPRNCLQVDYVYWNIVQTPHAYTVHKSLAPKIQNLYVITT